MQTLDRAAQSEDRTDEGCQLVALQLGDELYGIDLDYIHTVIAPQAITVVPRALEFIEGVINLRGRILPVIDLRKRFGLPPLAAEKRKGQRIVIVDAAGLTAGLIVDSVSEVLRLPGDAIAPPSLLVASAETECITGIGRVAARGDQDERLIILLDVARTLTTGPDDREALQTLQANA